MRLEITMPALGYDMEVGTIHEWLKVVGEPIARGEPIAVIETDKAEVEMEAVHSGRLSEILAQPGTEVAVGEVIAYLEAE